MVVNGPDRWGDEATSLLASVVRKEIEVVLAVISLDLAPEIVDNMVWGVVTGIDYGFDFRWNPKWVAAGEAHIWREDDVAYARCTLCLEVSPPAEGEAEARDWHYQPSGGSRCRQRVSVVADLRSLDAQRDTEQCGDRPPRAAPEEHDGAAYRGSR